MAFWPRGVPLPGSYGNREYPNPPWPSPNAHCFFGPPRPCLPPPPLTAPPPPYPFVFPPHVYPFSYAPACPPGYMGSPSSLNAPLPISTSDSPHSVLPSTNSSMPSNPIACGGYGIVPPVPDRSWERERTAREKYAPVVAHAWEGGVTWQTEISTKGGNCERWEGKDKARSREGVWEGEQSGSSREGEWSAEWMVGPKGEREGKDRSENRGSTDVNRAGDAKQKKENTRDRAGHRRRRDHFESNRESKWRYESELGHKLSGSWDPIRDKHPPAWRSGLGRNRQRSRSASPGRSRRTRGNDREPRSKTGVRRSPYHRSRRSRSRERGRLRSERSSSRERIRCMKRRRSRDPGVDENQRQVSEVTKANWKGRGVQQASPPCFSETSVTKTPSTPEQPTAVSESKSDAPNEDAPNEEESTPLSPVWIRCTHHENYYSSDPMDQVGESTVVGTSRQRALCDELQRLLGQRQMSARAARPQWQPPSTRLDQHAGAAKDLSESGSESDSELSSANSESSSECEPLDVIAEIRRRKAHPDRLHDELWYNDPGQMNDGPLCKCSMRAQRTGIRHSMYPGEQPIEACRPTTNNAGRLFHYRVTISPPTNFLTDQPTVIEYDDHEYIFEGFSLLSHTPLVNLPQCKVVRFNIDYTVLFIEEAMPEVRQHDHILPSLVTCLS
uniref:Uncharacterized protein n=1 Tax=Eptatretus burgeri TaxID=7764 RepID=A0A8C4RAR8_EPTBU